MRRGGDFFGILTIISTLIFGVIAVYWVAALGFAAIVLAFGLLSGVCTRLFRWPVRHIAIPLAIKLHLGRSYFGSILGILFTIACVVVSVGMIREFNVPAVRRIGQGLYTVREHLGKIGETAHAIAAEGIGNQRIERWIEWVWAEDMSHDDTYVHLSKEDNRLPKAAFSISDRISAWGRTLMEKVYEGEYHKWFLYLYWLAVAAVAPMMAAAFIITVFQISARRLVGEPGWFSTVTTAVLTFGLVYCLVSGFYLMPYVSHPYHNMNIPFWFATIVYVVAGSIALALVRANQHILFNPEDTPKEFVNPRAFKPTRPKKAAAPKRTRSA